MSLEIKVPVLPESVADATVAAWHKKPGEPVSRDESLVDIETDKVVLEVVAPEDGVIEQILKDTGSVVKASEVIATFVAKPRDTAAPAAASAEHITIPYVTETIAAPAAEAFKAPVIAAFKKEAIIPEADTVNFLSPSQRRSANENKTSEVASQPQTAPQQQIAPQPVLQPQAIVKTPNVGGNRIEKRVPMTRLRAKIAERLLAAQQNAAILTTFNEINMQPVMALRSKYKEDFEEKYGVRLGFMSFFVTAVVAALKRFPAVNASIDGNDIVYHGYFDIGIAVSTTRGLVVPILRDADTLSMAEIERKIKTFSLAAQDGKLSIEDITGGTFTITNGGVFGSLMATPILNPPQSGILGMHKIEDRPVVENKQVVIKPMMYVALSYDHRIIDGAESVQFLVAIKELLEEPARLLLSI